MALENLGLPYVPTLLEALSPFTSLESVRPVPPYRGGTRDEIGNSSGTSWDEMGRMDEQRSEQGEQRRPRPKPLTTHLLEPQNRRDEWDEMRAGL